MTTPNPNAPEVFIQWKGTDACIDFWCACGAQGHFDGYFAYRLRCGACGATYAMPDTLPIERVEDDPTIAAATQTVEMDVD